MAAIRNHVSIKSEGQVFDSSKIMYLSPRFNLVDDYLGFHPRYPICFSLRPATFGSVFLHKYYKKMMQKGTIIENFSYLCTRKEKY